MHIYRIARIIFAGYTDAMDRKTIMQAVERRAFALRVPLSTVCKDAGVSTSIASRWTTGKNTPSLATIASLEKRLTQMEKES